MINIKESSLISLLPPNIRENSDVIAACKAIDGEFQLMADSIKNTLIFADINNVSEKLLDHLAIEINTDFYDNTLSLGTKRNLVKNALIYHFTKGTPHAVELLVTDAFDSAKVEEWFEYGGDPFYFKVTTSDAIIDPNKINQLIEAISSIKNMRSHLESINIERITVLQPSIGILISGGDITTLSTNIPT